MLQKYRLYLKKMTKQASMATALGVEDSSYAHMCTLDGFGDLHPYTGSGRLKNTAFSLYTPGGILGRLNSSAAMNIRGITSSGLIQPNHPQSLNNSFSSLGKFQQSKSASQNSNLFQGIPTSLELNQLQQIKCTSHVGVSNPLNDPTSFTLPTSFPDGNRLAVGCSSNSMSIASSSPLILQGKPQPMHRVASGNLGLTSSNPESFGLGISGSSNFVDHNRFSESWQGAAQLSKFPSNVLPTSGTQGHLHSNNFDISSTSSQIGINCCDLSSTRSPSCPLETPSVDVQCEEGLIRNIALDTNYSQKHSWEEHKQDYNHSINQTFNANNSLASANANVDPLSQSLDQSNAVCCKNISASILDQFSGFTPSAVHPNVVDKSAIFTKMNPDEDNSDQSKSQDGCIRGSYESLDDIMNSMMKSVRQVFFISLVSSNACVGMFWQNLIFSEFQIFYIVHKL